METKIRMISAASRVLSFMKKNPLAIDEEIFQDLSDYIHGEDIKYEKIIRCMIASGTKAVKLKRKDRHKTDKQILRVVIDEIPQITNNIDDWKE